jgi:hypothetical protein
VGECAFNAHLTSSRRRLEQDRPQQLGIEPPHLLTRTPVSLSRSELRWELATIAACVALVTSALAAIALFLFRRRTLDLILIYFGLVSILYAARLLASRPSFRFLFDKSPGLRQLGHFVHHHFPFGLFLYEVGGDHFRKLIRWLLGAQAVYAVCGILATGFRSQRGEASIREQHPGARHVRGRRAVLGRH